MNDRARQLQQALADNLKADGLFDAAIEAAFRAVPRHIFLPGFDIDLVYTDEAVATKFLDDGCAISSSSQPTIMAIMLGQLDIAPGQRILEIGAGTGYNAALMAHIVGEEGRIVSVDLDQDTAGAAREHLTSAGFTNVDVVCADGHAGFADRAPYDRVILTVGATDISPAWWQQLAPGGRLVTPLELMGPRSMVSAAFDICGDHLESRSVRSCGFMMLRGDGVQPKGCVGVDQSGAIYLGSGEHLTIDPDAVSQALAQGARDLPSGVRTAPWNLERDLRFWLARSGFSCFILCRNRSAGSAVGRVNREGERYLVEQRLGVMRDRAMCTLEVCQPGSDGLGATWVSYYGAAKELACEVVDRLRDWERAGWPSVECLRIRAYPVDAAETPPAQIVLEKGAVRLLLDWPEGY